MEPDDEREIEEARALFRALGLLPPIPGQDDDDVHEAELLRRRILGTRRAHPGAGRPRWLPVAAAATVVAFAGGAYALLPSVPATAVGTPAMLAYSVSGPESLDSAPSAAEVLTSAARSAATTLSPGAPGGVQHVATYGWSLSVNVDPTGPVEVAVYPTFTQWWLDPDGAVRVDESRSAPLGLDGRLAADVEGAPDDVTSEVHPAGTIDPDVARQLSSDPTTLRAELLDTQVGLPCSDDARWQAECLVRAIAMLHEQYVVPPQIASAMWSVLADESAVRSLGSTVDRLGRPANAVALPSEPGQPSGAVLMLLISEGTGAYLGAETVTLHDELLGIDEPTVTGFTALTVSRWVAALGDGA